MTVGTEHDPKLGPCCICEDTVDVHNIIMLNRRCVIPGHGWGCVICDLPADGASAVLCDHCLERYQHEPGALLFACRGYPAEDGRVPIVELPEGVFDHDEAKHEEEDF